MPAICQWTDCGATLDKPARGRPSRWCAEHRQSKYRSPDSNMALCKETDCARPVRAHSMCSMHYRRGRPITMLTIPCDACGKPCRKEPSRLNKYATLYCTPKCKTEHQWRESRAARKTVAIYDPSVARANKNRPRRKTASAAPQRTFRCVTCAACSHTFIAIGLDATCSRSCSIQWAADKRAEAAHRRRARQRNAYRSPVVRSAIYLRDDYTCQLCMKPMDMAAMVPHSYAPTIDHTIPLARGGTHEPSNVQAAHFICNSYKSDRLPAEMAGLMAAA
jgi:5-methylcytosine-specific restriction endonuclease McrA